MARRSGRRCGRRRRRTAEEIEEARRLAAAKKKREEGQAQTLEDLLKIRRNRGYKNGWARSRQPAARSMTVPRERAIQNAILLALAKAFHPRGLFRTCDTGQFIPVAEIKRAIAAIIAQPSSALQVLRSLRRMSIGVKGWPDIEGIPDGLWIGIEVKRPGQKQRPVQRAAQAAIERAGGIYIVATSVEEAVTAIQQALANHPAAAKNILGA